MFWPHDPEAQGNALPKPWPYYTLGLMGVFVVVYLVSLFGSGTEEAIKAAKEKVVCAYLKRDYTRLPASVLRLLPKELRRHHKRTSVVVLRYDRDPGTANALGQKWLMNGDWDAQTSNNLGDKSCLQQAIASGLFGQPPKQRLFVALSQLSTHERHKQQKKLDQLVGAYQQTRQSHPLYGWGLIGSERRGFTFVTSLFLTPSWFVLLWQLLFLWVLGTFLARRWQSPLWMGVFWITGLLGNFLLLPLIGKSDTPMVGSGVALAGLVGMWAAAVGIKDVSYSYWRPKAPAAGKFTFQGWYLLIAWLVLAGLSSLLFHPHPLSHIIVQLLGVGIGAGTLFALERFDVIVPKMSEATRPAPLVKGRSLSKQTFGGLRKKSTNPRPKALRLEAAAPKVDQAKIDRLNEQVTLALAGGKKDGAVELYRAAIKEEKGALWVLEGLLITCEKAAIVARPEEYLRAIRAAVTAKENDKTRTFLSFLMRHRDTGAIELTSRDLLGLSTDLRRAGLHQEALSLLEELLQENDENAFYIKGSLLRANCMRELGRPPQEIIAQLNHLEPLLEKFPDFRGVVMQELQRAQQQLGVSAEAIQTAPSTSPGVAVASSGPAVASPKSPSMGMPQGPAVASPKSTPPLHPSASGGAPLSPAPPSISAASNEEREVDTSLLEEIEMFEALRAPAEREPAADSWSELPSLLLKQDSEDITDDGPSMFESKKEDENIKKLDDGKSAQQRLAEEVTAAFDVSSLQDSLGGSDWGTRWDDDEDEAQEQQAPAADDGFGGPSLRPAEDGGAFNHSFSTDGFSADGLGGPPASRQDDFDGFGGGGFGGFGDSGLTPSSGPLSPQAGTPLPSPTTPPVDMGLLPMSDEAPPRPPPAVPASLGDVGLLPMDEPPLPQTPAPKTPRPAENTMGNYRPSLPPIPASSRPSQMPADLNETRRGPVQLMDSAALLPDDPNAAGPPRAPKTPSGGLLDLTEEIEDPRK